MCRHVENTRHPYVYTVSKQSAVVTLVFSCFLVGRLMKRKARPHPVGVSTLKSTRIVPRSVVWRRKDSKVATAATNLWKPQRTRVFVCLFPQIRRARDLVWRRRVTWGTNERALKFAFASTVTTRPACERTLFINIATRFLSHKKHKKHVLCTVCTYVC